MDSNQIEDAEFEELDPEPEAEPDKPSGSAYPTQVVLTIRTIVGGYER